MNRKTETWIATIEALEVDTDQKRVRLTLNIGSGRVASGLQENEWYQEDEEIVIDRNIRIKVKSIIPYGLVLHFGVPNDVSIDARMPERKFMPADLRRLSEFSAEDIRKMHNLLFEETDRVLGKSLIDTFRLVVEHHTGSAPPKFLLLGLGRGEIAEFLVKLGDVFAFERNMKEMSYLKTLEAEGRIPRLHVPDRDEINRIHDTRDGNFSGIVMSNKIVQYLVYEEPRIFHETVELLAHEGRLAITLNSNVRRDGNQVQISHDFGGEPSSARLNAIHNQLRDWGHEIKVQDDVRTPFRIKSREDMIHLVAALLPFKIRVMEGMRKRIAGYIDNPDNHLKLPDGTYQLFMDQQIIWIPPKPASERSASLGLEIPSPLALEDLERVGDIGRKIDAALSNTTARAELREALIGNLASKEGTRGIAISRTLGFDEKMLPFFKTLARSELRIAIVAPIGIERTLAQKLNEDLPVRQQMIIASTPREAAQRFASLGITQRIYATSDRAELRLAERDFEQIVIFTQAAIREWKMRFQSALEAAEEFWRIYSHSEAIYA